MNLPSSSRTFEKKRLLPRNFGVALLGCLVLVVGIDGARAQSLFTDDFDSGLGNWATGESGTGALAPAVSGGLLSLSAGAANNGRSLIRSNIGADLDPFDQSLSFQFSGIAFSGTPSPGSNVFYAMIGRTQQSSSGGVSGVGNYFPNTASTDSGYVTMILRQRPSTATVPGYSISILQMVQGTQTAISTDQAITAVPTSMQWTLSLDSSSLLEWTVTLGGGALFSANDSATLSGEFTSGVTASLLANAYLSLGAWNSGGAVVDGTAVTLDSVGVAAAPEPGIPGLAACTLGVLWGLRIFSRTGRRRGRA